MIRNLLATTAIATLVATGAFAQEATQPATTTDGAARTIMTGHLASNIIGETVYNGTAENAENIGEVNDIVIGENGAIESIIIGVGGFLGLGERDVAFEYANVDWAERDGDRWLVVPSTKEELEALTPFDRMAYEPAAPTATTTGVTTDATAPAADTTAMAPATETMAPAAETTTMAPADGTTTAPAAEATTMAPAADGTSPAADTNAMAPAAETTTMAPAADGTTTTAPAADTTAMAPADPAADTTTMAAIDRSTLTEMNAGDMSAEDMVGTTVYGADDANVGEIGDVLLTADGQVDAYVIDVGGFLGIGEKEVAVGAENLMFMNDTNNNRYLFTNFTKEQLEAQTAYDEGTYATTRDNQRLIYTQ